jgi:hypothetical protein
MPAVEHRATWTREHGEASRKRRDGAWRGLELLVQLESAPDDRLIVCRPCGQFIPSRSSKPGCAQTLFRGGLKPRCLNAGGRGARVIAVAGPDKAPALIALGCARVLGRDANLVDALGREAIDAVVDVVGGPGFPQVLKALKRGGRYATSGAIAGPVVSLDLRDLYLKDITLIGGTAWDEPVFPDLLGYIERNEIRPLLAKTYPLSDIAAAQEEFLAKRHVGKLVLIPPP